MAGHTHAVVNLTKNQQMVLDALSGSDGPLSAYTILDQLREQGFRAPPQVYRALDKLVDLGLVHRLESLNAYVACSHPDCDTHEETIAFAICEDCGQVAEISDDALSEELGKIAGRAGFQLKKSTVELRGICGPCQGDAGT